MGAVVSRATGTIAPKAASQAAAQKAPRAASQAARAAPSVKYEHKEQTPKALVPPYSTGRSKGPISTSTNSAPSPSRSSKTDSVGWAPQLPGMKHSQEVQSGKSSVSPEGHITPVPSTHKPQNPDLGEPKADDEPPRECKILPSEKTTASDGNGKATAVSKEPGRSDRKARRAVKKDAKRAEKRAEKTPTTGRPSVKALPRRASQRTVKGATTTTEEDGDELDKLWNRLMKPNQSKQQRKEPDTNKDLVHDRKLENEFVEEEPLKEDEFEEEAEEEKVKILEEKKCLMAEHASLGSKFVDIFYPFETPDGRRGSLVAKRDEMIQVGPAALFPSRSVYVEMMDSASSSLYPSPLANSSRSYRSVHRYVLSPDVLLTDGTPSDQVCAILTDGSFSSDRLNPRQFIAGWAFDTGSEMISGPIMPPAGLPGNMAHPSNSVLTELFAIWRALDWLHRSGEMWPVVVIVTDSAACVNMVTSPSFVKSHSSVVSVRGLLLLLSRMKTMNGLKKILFWRVSRDMVKSCDVAADWERMRIQIHDKVKNSQRGPCPGSLMYP